MSVYKTTMEIDDVELPVSVHFEAVPFCRGSTDGPGGPKLEPDEPAHIDIDWVQYENGDTVELTPGQLAMLRDEIGEMLSEEEDAAREREY